MNCNKLIKKYNNLLLKINNSEIEIKINNDSPLLKSYYIEENYIYIKKLFKFKKKYNNILHLCEKKHK